MYYSRKIGELFGASIICDINIPHDQIWISPKEEALFKKLIEFEALIKSTRVVRLRETLEFYADKENWDDDFTPTIWDDGSVDLGKRANQALKADEALNEPPK